MNIQMKWSSVMTAIEQHPVAWSNRKLLTVILLCLMNYLSEKGNMVTNKLTSPSNN